MSDPVCFSFQNNHVVIKQPTNMKRRYLCQLYDVVVQNLRVGVNSGIGIGIDSNSRIGIGIASRGIGIGIARWNKVNPGYFPLTATALKPQQISMFVHISARVWGRWLVISTHIRTEGFYVKTAIIHQSKRLCGPDCAYMDNMFINFIHISLYDIFLMQEILYQIKGDVAVWKSLGCPHRKQRTWWQIVATPYTGLA